MYAYDGYGNRYDWDTLSDFTDDPEKMHDFNTMHIYDFLKSYMYLTEVEYWLTYSKVNGIPVYYCDSDGEFYTLIALVTIWATDPMGETFAEFLHAATYPDKGMLTELKWR